MHEVEEPLSKYDIRPGHLYYPIRRLLGRNFQYI